MWGRNDLGGWVGSGVRVGVRWALGVWELLHTMYKETAAVDAPMTVARKIPRVYFIGCDHFKAVVLGLQLK